MQKPSIVLDILKSKSINSNYIDKIYHYLYNSELYLYILKNNSSNIEDITKYKNLISNMIDKLKLEQYKWKKEKTSSFTTQDMSDKILRKTLYHILNIIYSPIFKESSESYTKHLNVCNALKRIQQKGIACEWFIQWKFNDIVNSIDYKILLDILSNRIKDGRVIELIRKFLKAGVLGNDFYNYESYSEIPVGGDLTPLLFNIYLNQLDEFIETNLVSKFNIDSSRPINPKYYELAKKLHYRQRVLNHESDSKIKEYLDTIKNDMKILRSQLRKIPYKEEISKCNFRRLTYTRYLNDCLIAFTGSYDEACSISKDIENFLKDKLNIKEVIINIHKSDSNHKPVRFLNFNLITQWSSSKIVNGQRTLNGSIAFLIPHDVITNIKKLYTKNNKPIHLSQYIHNSDFDIVSKYQNTYKGYCQYYKFVRNQSKLGYIKWILETSMVKTLASKFKTTVQKIYKKYGSTYTYDNYTYKVLKVVKNINDKTYTSMFGGIPLKCNTSLFNIEDCKQTIFTQRSSYLDRISKNVCEICGNTEDVEIHHIKKLNIKTNDIKCKDQRKALHRKTIALCNNCHKKLHAGIL